MPGERDLETMLRSLTVSRRPSLFGVVSTLEAPPMSAGIEALIRETEGITVIARTDVVEARGWEPAFVGAWLTLDVHSSLEAVGLTAAVSAALAEQDIPCNVIAGHTHDHLLVPPDRADDAIAAIAALSMR